MKMNHAKKFMQTTTLAAMLTFPLLAFAAPVDRVIAVVDNSVILESDLQQAVAEAVHRLKSEDKAIPPEQYIKRDLLEQLITRQAQLEQVKRFNVKIDDRTLNEAVLKVAAQNNLDNLEAFQEKLDQIAPGTYAGLRNRIAEDLSITRLRQQQVMSRIKITDQDVVNFLKSPQGQAAIGNQAHVIHARVSGTEAQALKAVATQVKQALDQENVNAQQIASTYTKDLVRVDVMDMGYRNISEIPAELAARVTALNNGQTTEIIEVKDGLHILKLVDIKSGDKKALVPQISARHILIQPSEVVSPEVAKLQAERLYEQLQAGADFATLAATYSADPGSARDGGSLGWVSPGTMVPEFEEVMRNTVVGQISKPFQTQFGWHVLKVDATREQDMTEELQKRMAQQLLGERQFDTEVDSWLREVRANAYVEIKDKSLDN